MWLERAAEGSESAASSTGPAAGRKSPSRQRLHVRSPVPRIDDGNSRVAELALVPRDDGKASTNDHSGEHGIGEVVLERFLCPTFFVLFYQFGTGARVVHRSIKSALLEQLVENPLKPSGKVAVSFSRIEASHAVEDFPNGNQGDADPVFVDPVEESSNPRLGDPHHFRDILASRRYATPCLTPRSDRARPVDIRSEISVAARFRVPVRSTA